MSKVDAAIAKVGLPASIVRAAGDLDTYILVSPKARSASASFEFEAWLPTDSGATFGDLVQVTFKNQTISYLIVNLVEDERAGQFFKFNARVARCNHTITVKDYDGTTKQFTTTKTGVPCLITDGGTMQMSDMGVVLPGFGGKDGTYYLYCQPNGIDRKSVLTDEDNNRLKISGEINPYFAKGLVEIPVKVE